MRFVECLKARLVLAAVLCIVASLTGASPAQTALPSPCAAAEYHQFDFWVGNWDVFDTGSPVKVAHARIDSILDGCVLREDYQGNDGHRGQSLTIYDMSRKVWHQTWVTNRGELLQIEGNFENGEMVLSGTNQKGALVRGTWRPLGNRGVREIAVTSSDSGRSWKPWFDLVFRATASETSQTGAPEETDKQILAALDAQYQAAVKLNDAATMNKILADDFVLVTGSGKSYTKPELLEEAHSGRIHYERQEDTDKTVRTWGNTAVVTARLEEKGTDDGKPFAKTVWFSDTYVRNPDGWRYVLGQSSLPACKQTE